MTRNMEVAQTILNQLGGNRFILFTGSKDLIALDGGLRMALARNGSRANRLDVTLNGDDTYTMRFYRHTNGGLTVNRRKGTAEFKEPKDTDVRVFEHIYCDQLQELFTEATGLYTHF